MNPDLLRLARGARIYDLGQPYYVGMPHYPTHPPFLFSLTKKHGEYMIGADASSAAESIALGTHVGTHMDALCHFSRGGRLHGGVEAGPVQSYEGGVGHLSIDTVAPVFRRGVLLDIATQQGVDALPADFSVTPEHLEAAARAGVEPGDVVLLRTGWGQFWSDPRRYISEVHGPGPELAAAQWLSRRGIFAAGSDTIAFEKIPSSLPVHGHLLVESGIHIIEALNLEELARSGAAEFLFVALPLKIRGATGSPIRPVALL